MFSQKRKDNYTIKQFLKPIIRFKKSKYDINTIILISKMNLTREKEKEDGNSEYKRKLLDNSQEKIDKLASQMKYRCQEGNGECTYTLGIGDNGEVLGMTGDEYETTMNILNKVAETNNYSISLITETSVDANKKMYEYLVRENNENRYIEIKVAICGSVDSGKSSLLGVLVSNRLDNGKGSSRLEIFNYSHEAVSGRTSSIAQHIIGFNNQGKIINYKDMRSQGSTKISWPEIVQNSSKIISFYDLAGHKKYLKTTILGLTATQPDMCFITVGANRGVLPMTREHIFLCVTLKIPFVIILTKIDMASTCPDVFQNTVESINKILKFPGIRRLPLKIKNIEDVVIASRNVYTESLVPIFQVSSVSGEGLDLLKQFLNIVGRRQNILSSLDNSDVEYHVENIFHVAGVGIVSGGQLLSGTIRVGDKLLLGPNNNQYEQVVIKSIHCKKVPLQTVSAGCYVCLGLKKIDRKNIKKGNVMISLRSEQLLINSFTAEISVIRCHSTTIKPGYQPVMHSGNIRQSVSLVNILSKNENERNSATSEDLVLRTGDRAVANFRLCFRSEYLKVGSTILLCEGQTKLTGVILEVSANYI
jgi:GTPase